MWQTFMSRLQTSLNLMCGRPYCLESVASSPYSRSFWNVTTIHPVHMPEPAQVTLINIGGTNSGTNLHTMGILSLTKSVSKCFCRISFGPESIGFVSLLARFRQDFTTLCLKHNFCMIPELIAYYGDVMVDIICF